MTTRVPADRSRLPASCRCPRRQPIRRPHAVLPPATSRPPAAVATLLLLAVALPSCRTTAPTAARLQLDLTPDFQLPIELTTDTRIQPDTYWLPDQDDTGALVITTDGITVDFQGATLIGSRLGDPPDRYVGTGIVVRAHNVTLTNAHLRGYRVGIYAENADGLTLTRCDVSDNYAQHLGSTIAREDAADWLSPHRNDDREWLRYGAGIYIRNSGDVTVTRCRARRGQNGLILDRVHHAQVCDNDFSFLSGWGLALWRTSDSVISRNALDFCIRGYSHGRYNRGQDSAGILMFEQCCRNVIAENSVTHGGDGVFAFAGRDALGETWLEQTRAALRAETGRQDVDDLIVTPTAVLDEHRRRGTNDNLFIRNDLSYAAAHGLELTFSFGNRILNNRLVGNAICGIWGGYCQDLLVAHNRIAENGETGYGMERGGVNIEHGRANRIVANEFARNTCGVHLWWDSDAAIFNLPWAKANHQGSTDNLIAQNVFDHDALAVHLRHSTDTVLVQNRFRDVGDHLEADAGFEPRILLEVDETRIADTQEPAAYTALGETRPVGARAELAGRDKILMTEWGPYDYESALVSPARITGGQSAQFYVLAPRGEYHARVVTGDVTVTPPDGPLPALLTVTARQPGVTPFELAFDTPAGPLTARGLLVQAEWDVAFYRWPEALDPRADADHWQRIIAEPPLETRTVGALDFTWQTAAPGPAVPADHFATVATTQLQLPAGTWHVATVSDDGVRVFVDGTQVLSNWTWHAPTRDDATVDLSAGVHEFRVEHFEIDGWAALQFELSPAGGVADNSP